MLEYRHLHTRYVKKTLYCCYSLGICGLLGFPFGKVVAVQISFCCSCSEEGGGPDLDVRASAGGNLRIAMKFTSFHMALWCVAGAKLRVNSSLGIRMYENEKAIVGIRSRFCILPDGYGF
jgi:hypothetical protein